MNKKIGIFGCGNMGEALALGFRSKSSELEIYLYNPTLKKAQSLANKVQGIVVNKLHEMPLDCDWYVLGFKPQSLSEFQFQFNPGAKILSVLAGVGIKTLERKFQKTKIARLMPNTPSKLGLGANLFYAEFEDALILESLNSLGKIFIMKSEEELDRLTGVSGSGPAIIFEFALAFYENALNAGLDSNESMDLINQTFLGSVSLMEKARLEGTSLEVLRDQVVSKKGVTHEALATLRSGHLNEILNSAFQSAYLRTLELKKEIDHA